MHIDYAALQLAAMHGRPFPLLQWSDIAALHSWADRPASGLMGNDALASVLLHWDFSAVDVVERGIHFKNSRVHVMI